MNQGTPSGTPSETSQGFISISIRLLLAGLLGVILGIDRVFLNTTLLPVHAVADELSHASTGFIWLLAARCLGLRVSLVAGVLCAVLIDLDHVPVILGWIDDPTGTTRPITHSLAMVAVLLTGAVLDRPRRAWWLAGGISVLSHLTRDMGTGTVRLLWPVSSGTVSISYGHYLAVMAVITAIPFIWARGAFVIPATPLGAHRIL